MPRPLRSTNGCDKFVTRFPPESINLWHATVCQSSGRIFRWRTKFGGLEVSDAKRLRELERENQQLKKLVAERDLEIDILKDINRKKW